MTTDIPQAESEELPLDPPEAIQSDAPEPADPSRAAGPGQFPEAPAEPEDESDEAWMRRFIEENIHLASPPVVRPPAPPPQPWDGPRSQWKVPDHLSMPHPKGGYMAMALMSRTMDDLDEVTGGKRAATYEEVDKYFGHALIAEGLVPFTYTADEASRWWKAGGFRTLANEVVPHGSPQPVPDASRETESDRPAETALAPPQSATMPDAMRPVDISSGSVNHAIGETIWANASALDEGEPLGEPVPGPEKAKVTPPPGTVVAGKGKQKAVPQKIGADIAPPTPTERALTLAGWSALIAKRAAGAASNDPYSADNLKLGVNVKYLSPILVAARRFNLPPQILAAFIGAEARPNQQNKWDPNSRNSKTGASGLMQFTADTWTGEGERRGSYLNGVARGLGYIGEKGEIAPAYKKAFLDLRFNADHSIIAAADYAAFNLARLEKNGLILDKSPAALARYAYVAHHEGLSGASDYLQGKNLSSTHWNQNVPKDQKDYWLDHYGPDLSTAYRFFMNRWTDDKIDVTRYMYDPGGIAPPATATLYGRRK